MLGAISAEEFLAHYWQQKSLFIEASLTDFTQRFNADAFKDELAAAACYSDAPSRLILEHGLDGSTPWQVIEGPLDESIFSQLPSHNWTLLVNDVEQIFDDFHGLSSQLHFLPQWRFDDLMLSYACEGGSVGPHLDQYDVFLIQICGQRRWEIDQQFTATAEASACMEGVDLAILNNFNRTDTYLAKPGDVLYLPPNVPHFGTAEDDNCITLSVGFKSPNEKQLMDWLTDNLKGDMRYQDPMRSAQSPLLLSTKDVDGLTAMIKQCMDQDHTLAELFAQRLSENRPTLDASPTSVLEINEANHYRLHPSYKPCILDSGVCFIDGQKYSLDEDAVQLLERLVLSSEIGLVLVRHIAQNTQPNWLENIIKEGGLIEHNTNH